MIGPGILILWRYNVTNSKKAGSQRKELFVVCHQIREPKQINRHFNQFFMISQFKNIAESDYITLSEEMWPELTHLASALLV